MFYSKTTGGFYSRDIHGDNIPADAVEISDEQYVALLEGQAQGKTIVAGANGKPTLVTPPGPTLEERAAAARAERDRRLAETDWTQLADVSDHIKALWAPYRQALRDVPQQTGFPDEIVWPVKP